MYLLFDMKRAFCLLNHILTEKQISELKEKFGVKTIVYTPESLSKKWSQIPATPKIDSNVISSTIQWLSVAQPGDILIVQGEFGSTFVLVDYGLKNKLVPVHAVTKRVSEEKRSRNQITKQNVFKHVCFRKYEYFSESFVNFSE